MMHRLDISNLRLEYGFRRILWDVSLHCETGKVVGLLGRNGSGKTCLMKAVYGELKLQEQYVGIDGRVLLTRERSPEDMRYLPQHHFIPPGLPVKRVFNDFGVDFDRFAVDYLTQSFCNGSITSNNSMKSLHRNMQAPKANDIH